MAFRTEEQILTAFKARFGIAHTAMSNRDWFAEIFGVKEPPYAEDIWAEFPPSTNQFAYHDGNVTLDAAIRQTRTWNGSAWGTVAGGNTIPVEKMVFPLTRLLATNDQSHIALATPQADVSASSVTPAQRLIDFIQFSHYGTDFMPRLFWDNGSGTAPGTEITTVSLPNDWIFDAPSGLLLCGADLTDQFIPSGNLPIWVQHYRYVGTKGVASSGDVQKTQEVACLTTDSVGDLMCIRDVMTATNRWRVQAADCTDITKMPAVGVLISKTTPTTGIMQLFGDVTGLFSGLDVTKKYFVGPAGTLVTPAPFPGVGSKVHVQRFGFSVSSTVLWLTGENGSLYTRRG